MLLPRTLLLVLASALVAVQGQTTPSQSSAVQSSQSSANSQSATQRPTQTTVTSTSFSLSQSFSGRTAVTVTVPVVVTFVPGGQGDDSGPPVPPGNNGEQDANNQTTVDTRTWPTAAKTREGGPGGGTNGAPLPGQDSAGGLYGPPDDYIAAGVRTAALSVGALLFGIAAVGLI
ncbi:hypothetical protein AURDEDRAFT_113328 [Auricularia subglabra TFB-10046 SS5]|nr:hypothetical protein AURDEDRAFT_113328 [Auricularia subglabra TFB-10046 SS5]